VSSASLVAACAAPGYNPARPTEIVCGCHDGASCYDAVAAVAKARGENAESGEELLYLAQCACFQESFAGCNTLAHFAKDWVAACEAGKEVANACTIAGLVHEHGVRVPRLSGRSFDRDPAAARAAFERACQAGAAIACRHATAP
jgi:hypothetical protein